MAIRIKFRQLPVGYQYRLRGEPTVYQKTAEGWARNADSKREFQVASYIEVLPIESTQA